MSTIIGLFAASMFLFGFYMGFQSGDEIIKIQTKKLVAVSESYALHEMECLAKKVVRK